QAIDLVTRKLPLENGAVVETYIRELAETAAEVRASNQPAFGRMGERLAEAVNALADASRWMGEALRRNPEAALAGATPYLRLFGLAAGGIYLARGALACLREGQAGTNALPVALARFFAENLATAATGLSRTVTEGAETVVDSSPEQLSACGQGMTTDVEISVADGVQTIRFARPEKKNALNSPMYTAITEALKLGDASKDVVAHLFIGSGGTFTAGSDINEFLERARGGTALDGPVLEFL